MVMTQVRSTTTTRAAERRRGVHGVQPLGHRFPRVETARPTLVNGKLKPRMKTPPNQVERWRLVYAGSPDELGIKLHVGKDADCNDFDKTPIETTQIARDGITLPQFYKSDTMWVRQATAST